MTRFIERDKGGAIKGVYACLQPGYAEEEMAEDAPEIFAFLSPSRPVLIPYGVFERRWTDEELEALFDVRKTNWRVDRYITLASAQGHVNLTGVDDPDSGSTARAAKALFVALGVLTRERADAIFAAE